MLIFKYWCGQLDEMFTDKDIHQVKKMCSDLDSTICDTTDYKTENGDTIMYWRMDGHIYGNIFGHPESDIPESAIANANI